MQTQSRFIRYTHLAATAAFCATFALACVGQIARAQATTAPAQPPTASASASETHIALVFSGGHETDPRDRGRPVVLVAGGLGVTPEVFRDAFSRVHPAGPDSGGPTGDEARANKKVLLDALGKYGITNDRIDEISNYYRYVRSRGEMWPTQPAAGYAVVEKGKVTRFVVTAGGSGYSSAPAITVPGMPGVSAVAKVTYSTKSAAQNGTVSAVALAEATPTRK